MELVVELSTGNVVLSDVDRMKRFSVRVVPPHPGDGAGTGARGALAEASSSISTHVEWGI